MIDAIISGFLLGMALVFSVGPVIFTIIKLRINYGLKSAFYFIGGVWLSDLVWVVAANFFGSFLLELIKFNKTISWLGGAFLVGLGIFYLFFKKQPSEDQMEDGIEVSGRTNAGLFITGFLINTLNPAVIALWLAAATKAVSNSIDERVVLFAICLSLNMLADVLKIYLAGKLKKKLTMKTIKIVNMISGLLYIGFGIALIYGAY
jgi:threonine/homoserine/homoserine lactone efflux protein